jgi:hypothetical protein
MVQEGAWVCDRFYLYGFVRGAADLIRGFAGHFDIAAKGQQADFVVGFAVFHAEQARPKAERKRLNADTAELGYGKVSKLVDNDHNANEDDKSCDRNQKFMHSCAVRSSKRCSVGGVVYHLGRRGHIRGEAANPAN